MAKTDDKVKYPRATTPKGVAYYPWLNVPDTKFKSEGVYKVRLDIPTEEAQDMMDKLDAYVDEFFKATKATRKPADEKKKPLVKDAPYSILYDEDGENETGYVGFNFKLNAKVTIKASEGKPEKTLEFKPKFFDAKGTHLELPPAVYGGSLLRINYEPIPYFTASTGACGVSLRIHGVQIIKLVSTGSNESASDMGFEEEDGFTGNTFENNASGASDGDAGDAGAF